MHSRPRSVFAGRRVASFVRREFEVHDAILVSMIARVCVAIVVAVVQTVRVDQPSGDNG